MSRVVDYSTFARSINKSKRSKLVGFVHEWKAYKRIPERMIQVMVISGWIEYEKPEKERRRDSGEIRAFIKIQDDIVYFVFDKLGDDGKEEFSRTLIDEEAMMFLGATFDCDQAPQHAPITKKDGTPFAGFNGGRKRKTLTDEEKAQILAMREEGKNVNIIARELHISNRIISEFVKNN